MRNVLVSGQVHIPDLSRMAFKSASAASLLKCRYFSLIHPQPIKNEVCEAIEGVTRSYAQAWEIFRNGELRKIAVRASDRTYTLEFEQSPIKKFLPHSPELRPHGDFVTTIKVPRSAHGSWLACTAGFFGIIDECMLVALTTNESWPGARIKFDRVDWRGRTFNAVRYSDNKKFVEYLNIPKSICAQVINAYAEQRFVEASEAQRRLMPLCAGRA
jgi:hypothetical protein